MQNSDDKLYNLIDFYNREIKPFRYIYNCMFGININFTIEPEEVCHLIFGSVKNKNIPNAKSYKGILGFNNISTKQITRPPYQIRKEFNIKSDAFLYLPKLLNDPTAIFFNHEIVDKGKVPGFLTTSIDADFLLYKNIDNKCIHLFLKWSKEKNKLVPYSLLRNNKDNYISKQKHIKILDKHIVSK
ncbi:hypothetical protein OW763_16375 [Clostridium aestuarii]|uniref:Uncharacterized protein n=1 Tax=Clostridium aestuarii TaxID=338193 RepID=A0ABT4D7A1_9CLOT|nr:hypothetical protein [Clostridium aestuarii]MCY6485888.1 hypothetical protein [Clostridium aestuarii]